MTDSGATAAVARFVAETPVEAIPGEVLHEAKRTLINVLAVGLSASVDASVGMLESWDGGGSSDGGVASVIGRGRVGIERAALLNGYVAHLQDYDDTHFPTILHPSAPTWPAALAAAEQRHASGLETLAAFAIGGEVACRVAMSVHPWHYDAGWHITGTAGVFGAVAAAARVIGLSSAAATSGLPGAAVTSGLPGAAVEQALGLAGTHAAGVRETFGTNGKALHAGHSAAAGLRAAYLAEAGFTGPPAFLEGRRGFWAVHSPDGHDAGWIERIGAEGERWELLNNALKPFANGIVSQPLQDAVIQLRNAHDLQAGQVEAIEARVHPLVLELMNRADPQVGLEGKFSHQHCAAAALIDGAGHDAQFSDARVRDPEVVALRSKVRATVDKAVREDEVYVTIRLEGGAEHSIHIEHATGSPENPMTDAQLETKFSELAGEVVGEARAGELLEAAWKLDETSDIGSFMALVRQ
ncbi:MAG: MmgE/PrpD family protein [Dehalococcoidia bacterium]|jgi:2-methylcitrate dehydratase PrpD|nr:MmgE/PrpD family protein [Dehalococcoidia bacterium]